jgi:hypothetical protein
MRHLKQFLTIFLMVSVMFSIGLTADVQGAEVINGDPLRITVYNDSTMHVAFHEEQCGGNQYNANSKGSILLVNKEDCENVRGWGGGYNTFLLYNDLEPIRFTPVSNTLTTLGDTFTVVTVYNAGLTGDVQVTQTVSYTNGDYFYKIEWQITNYGSETYTGLRFRHGGDTSYMGGEPSIGNWGPGLGMVYLTNDQSDGLMGLYGALGFYGETPSPADNFAEFFPAYVESYMKSRHPLNGFWRDVPHDAAYALEWLRDSLAPGESWTVTAFERAHCDGPRVEVTGIDNGGECGETITVRFHVANFGKTEDTYDLSVISQNGWDTNLLGNNPITIGAADYAPVDVELTIPPLTATPDILTLTATSQSNGNVTDSHGANIFVTCQNLVCDIEVYTPTVLPSPCEVTITWFTTDPGLVKITLWQEDENGVEQNLGIIGNNIDAALGEYVWEVNLEDFPEFTNVRPARIKVKVKGKDCSDKSEPFSIVCSNPICPEGLKSLIDETNLDAFYEPTDNITIEWNYDNVPQVEWSRWVRLSLWTAVEVAPDVWERGNVQVGRIGPENVLVISDGTYTWMPTNLDPQDPQNPPVLQVYESQTNQMRTVPPGTYFLKIREKGRCHDYSDVPITILPRGIGNICTTGQKSLIDETNLNPTYAPTDEMTIEWNYDNVPPADRTRWIRLSLWTSVNGQPGEQVGRIGPENVLVVSDGTYTWTPTDLVPGDPQNPPVLQVFYSQTNEMMTVPEGTYFIKVREKGRCHDFSDISIDISYTQQP